MTQESTSYLYWRMAENSTSREAVRLMKRRRADLVSRACSREERAGVLVELRHINRYIQELEHLAGSP